MYIHMYKIYMHMYIKTLQEISDRYAPSRILSFNMVHVLIALQLIETRGHISRNLLCKELNLGEGSIKTLVKHLKTQNIIETVALELDYPTVTKSILQSYYHAFLQNVKCLFVLLQ